MTVSRMTPARFGLAYVVVLFVVLGLDAMWLGPLAGDSYKREMGPLMSGSVRVVPVVLFYLLYPLAFVYLVLFRSRPASARCCSARWRSAWPPTAPTTSPPWPSCRAGRSG